MVGITRSKVIFIFTPTWGRFPVWRAYFSNGLKPPTSFFSLRHPGSHRNWGERYDGGPPKTYHPNTRNTSGGITGGFLLFVGNLYFFSKKTVEPWFAMFFWNCFFSGGKSCPESSPIEVGKVGVGECGRGVIQGFSLVFPPIGSEISRQHLGF